VREERPAVLGELRPGAGAEEQPDAEVGLQLRDALGDGLLADRQAVRRLAEVPVLGDGHEGPDRAEIEVQRSLPSDVWL
jgi:hypothetical protein